MPKAAGLKSAGLLCILFFPGVAAGMTWYVEDSVPASGDGLSWETAFKTIQEGIDAASNGDTVIVAEGTYLENVRLEGKNIILQSTDPAASSIVENTVINGRGGDSVVAFSGLEGETCVLQGFTIINGTADCGGGIRGGKPGKATRAAIRNNNILGNRAVYNGGGVYACDGVIENNMISKNLADKEGGGLYGGRATIRRNTISDNAAYDGGGLCDCDGTIEDNSVWNNAAWGNPPVFPWGRGGGLLRCGGTIRDNVVAGNRAEDGGGGLCDCDGLVENNLITANRRGGLYACDGVIANNTITANDGQNGGGLALCNGAIRNNLIAGNYGGNEGGGIALSSGTIEGNTIAGNTGGSGGGLSRCDGIVERNRVILNSTGPGAADGGGFCQCYGPIRNNLIAGNTASVDGGGLFDCTGPIENNTIVCNSADSAGGLFDCSAVRNCIIWGNTARWSGSQVGGASGVVYCCVEGGLGGTGNIAKEPRFVDLDGPDDDPETYEDNDYRLLPDSPCIDAGINEDWMWGTLDLGGGARICKGASSPTVDMGAYEFFHVTIVGVKRKGGGEIELTWTSRSQEGYIVWSSVDLLKGAWVVEATITSEGTSSTWLDPDTTIRRKFYRVEIK